MLTVGDKIEKFSVTGVKPGQPQHPEVPFFEINQDSFPGKWKVIVYYPKDFTFVCPTEIVAYDKLAKDFEDRDAVLLTGSTDNEFCKVAWQKAHPDLQKITHVQFADTYRWTATGENLNLNVGRSPEETLRVLDALQTGELCACNRAVGGETL